MRLTIFGLCGQSVFLRVAHFHRPEETLHAQAMFAEPGGKGYNQAVAARRMGAETAFCGAIGSDADGEACTRRLIEEGIEPYMVQKRERTAFAAILTNDEGENRVTVYAGAQLSADDVLACREAIASASILLLTPEIPQEAFEQALSLAKESGVRVVINPAPYFPWVQPYFKEAWLLTPNRREALMMLGCGEEELMDRLAKAPYPRMIVTLGAQGAVCVENGVMTWISAPEVSAVDTTGAGDCLNGALCAFLMEGDTLAEAARKAVQAASISVQHAHVLDGMPLRTQITEE